MNDFEYVEYDKIEIFIKQNIYQLNNAKNRHLYKKGSVVKVLFSNDYIWTCRVLKNKKNIFLVRVI